MTQPTDRVLVAKMKDAFLPWYLANRESMHYMEDYGIALAAWNAALESAEANPAPVGADFIAGFKEGVRQFGEGDGMHPAPTEAEIEEAAREAAALTPSPPAESGWREIGLQAKRWPFVESPGDFAERFRSAFDTFGNYVSTIRNVLIEDPPTIAADYLKIAIAAAPAREG